MTAGLIIATVFVVIVLVVGLVLTISAANSMNEGYRSEKSFSSMLWAYLLTIPFIVIVTVIAIVVFNKMK